MIVKVVMKSEGTNNNFILWLSNIDDIGGSRIRVKVPQQVFDRINVEDNIPLDFSQIIGDGKEYVKD